MVYWTIVIGTEDGASGVPWNSPNRGLRTSARGNEVTEPWAEGGLGALGPADGGLRLETAGGTIVLGNRVVPRDVSYRLALEESLVAVVTLEPASRRLPVPVGVTSVAVSYRSLVPSDLSDGMLGWMIGLAVSPGEPG
jgi:hypothetical protein